MTRTHDKLSCPLCSTWGESFFIAVQVLVLLLLMYHYNKQMVHLAVFGPLYGVIVWYLTSDLVTMEILTMLQASVIPLMLISRVCDVMYYSCVSLPRLGSV